MKVYSKGFTLIDALVGGALALIVFGGILGAYEAGLKVLSQSRARITATALANQKLEMMRNLSYDNLGTVGGIPSGFLLQDEIVSRNNLAFSVRIVVVYVDDAFDGLAPADALSADYKSVKVEVSWTGRFGGSVELATYIVPKGVESDAGGGTLRIAVFDSQGGGVPQAQVHVENSLLVPSIDAWYQTDAGGQIAAPGSPLSIDGYRITASKAGYSSERTYAVNEIVGLQTLASPVKPHASVFEGQVTSTSFGIDRVSSFLAQTQSLAEGELMPVPNVAFTLRGAKTLGQDSYDQPVYKYSQEHVSDGAGQKTIENLEWDSYSFLVDKPATGLDLLSTDPLQPVTLLANTIQNAALLVSAADTLLVTVKNQTTSEPIFGVSVRLSSAGLGYDEIRPTDNNGKAFFIPLQVADYTLDMQMPGYEPENALVPVAGTTTGVFFLDPLP